MGSITAEKVCTIFEAMTSRRAIRAFLPTPVERGVIEEILTLAARAPSGSNIQPWKVWVASGAAKERVCDRIVEAFLNESEAYPEPWPYYPKQWTEPFLSRRRKLGLDLYKLAGIAKGDQEATKAHLVRNFRFFGAPVGIFVTIPQQMEIGSWVDLGGFIQSILLAARGFGLDTCPQAIFARFHRIIRAEMGIPEDEVVVCGIGLGFEDETATVNQLVTEREPVSTFATFREE